jgi:hypothetical protein
VTGRKSSACLSVILALTARQFVILALSVARSLLTLYRCEEKFCRIQLNFGVQITGDLWKSPSKKNLLSQFFMYIFARFDVLSRREWPNITTTEVPGGAYLAEKRSRQLHQQPILWIFVPSNGLSPTHLSLARVLSLGAVVIPTLWTLSCSPKWPVFPPIIFLKQRFSPSDHRVPGGTRVTSARIKISWWPLAAIAPGHLVPSKINRYNSITTLTNGLKL